MKLAILHSGDMKNVSLGGVDRYIKSLITFFDDNEITIYGVSHDHEYKIGKAYKRLYNGKKYTFIPIITDSKYPLSVRYFWKEFRYLGQLSKYDCIYAQRTEYTIPFAFSKSKRKVIQMIHGSSKYSEIFWGKKKAKLQILMERIAISIAKRTYVILNREEFGVPYYKKKYPEYADKIFYGRNPIDVRSFYPGNKKEEKEKLNVPFNKVIIYTGRIENKPKRVLQFPDIMKKVIERYPDTGFIVVGDGADLDELKLKVRKYKLNGHFIFTGYLDDSNKIADFLRCADVSINISQFEGTCTSNLESLACGVPVVSTDVGDIHECISGSENGIIIENKEENIVSDASQAIIKILKNGEKMNDNYKKYEGTSVIKALKNDIFLLNK